MGWRGQTVLSVTDLKHADRLSRIRMDKRWAQAMCDGLSVEHGILPVKVTFTGWKTGGRRTQCHASYHGGPRREILVHRSGENVGTVLHEFAHHLCYEKKWGKHHDAGFGRAYALLLNWWKDTAEMGRRYLLVGEAMATLPIAKPTLVAGGEHGA